MTTEPSPEYVNRQLQLADEAASDARFLLRHNRLKAAANRAYYAVFHAAHAALAHAGAGTPRTHAGVINLFGRHYIVTGKLDRRFAKDLQDAYDLRQQTDYEAFVTVRED